MISNNDYLFCYFLFDVAVLPIFQVSRLAGDVVFRSFFPSTRVSLSA